MPINLIVVRLTISNFLLRRKKRDYGMSINSVSMGMNATQWGAYKQKLSEATKAELQKLHIPFNDSTTEMEARALIAQALAKQDKTNNNQNNQNNAPKDNLFEQAEKLAQKLGIGVEKNIGFEELLAKIEETLEYKIKNSSNDIQMLNELKNYSRQLSFIQSQAMGATNNDATNQALMMSLEMLSQYNKSFING